MPKYDRWYCHNCQKYDYSKDSKVAMVLVIIVVVIVLIGMFTLPIFFYLTASNGSIELPQLGNWNDIQVTRTTATATFGAFVYPVDYWEFEVRFYEGDTMVGQWMWPVTRIEESETPMPSVGFVHTTITCTYLEYDLSGNKIDTGDQLLFENLTPNTTYTIELLELQSGTYVTMLGSNQFTTNP